MTSEVQTFVTVYVCLDGFATGNSDARRQFNLRVPVTATTTVRQLAKEAMRRLVVLARHRSPMPNSQGEHVLRLVQSVQQRRMAVTEVVVSPMPSISSGGAKAAVAGDAHARQITLVQPPELFSCDTVSRVVALSSEAVRLHLRTVSAEPLVETPQTAARARANTWSAELGGDGQSSTSTVELDALPQAAPAAVKAIPLIGKRGRDETESATQELVGPRRASVRSSSSSSSCSSSSNTSSSSSSASSAFAAKTIDRLRERETARRLRWGREAHKNFATNYVSSPEKLMYRRYTKQRSAAATQPTRGREHEESPEAQGDSPPPLTAPSGVGSLAASARARPHRDDAPLSSAAPQQSLPPAIPLELLPEATEEVVAARQLRFEDDDEEDAHDTGARREKSDHRRHAHKPKPDRSAQRQREVSAPLSTPPLAQPTSISEWAMWSPAKSAQDRTPTERAKTVDGHTTTATPSHFLTGAFSQPLPAMFRVARPGTSSSPTSKMSVPCTPTKGQLDEQSAADSPAPRTPPTEPRVASAATTTSHTSHRSLGWGERADKFFDPNTYCDDPNKAVLDESQLHQPVRARRNKEPSFVLRYIL